MAKRYSAWGILVTMIAVVCVAAVVGAVVQALNDITPARTTGTGAWNVQTLGRLPCGLKTALAVRGGYAYLAIGARLAVVDLSDPTTPEPVGWTEPLPNEISDIVVSGDYAYVADQYAGLRVVDISNPCNPFETGSYDTPGSASRVAVSGNYAYVADERGGLRIIDVSDPWHLVETSFRYVGYTTSDIAIVGEYAYAVSYGMIAVKGDYAYAAGDIYILDVSNPYAPVEVRHLSMSSSNLHILDVSTPSNPQELCEYHTYDLDGKPSAVDAAGKYAYLAVNGGTPFNQDGTLVILDLADPRTPARRGVLHTWGPLSAVAIAGDHAYLADYEKGLLTIDIRNPDSPTQVGAFLTPQYVADLAVHGDHLLIPSGEALTIVDTSDKSRPNETSFCDYGSIGGGGPVAVSGNYAFVAISEHLPVGRGREIWVMDVSNPHAPQSVGQWVDLNCCNSDLAVAGTYAYLTSYWGVLSIVDISQPERWWIGAVGYCNTPGDAHRVAVSGQYAYVADGPTGLRVISVSNPNHPMEVGAFATAGYAYSVAVADPYAYVAGDQVVHIVDVSDPTRPAEVGRVSIAGPGEDVAVALPYLFVADSVFGLHVFDVSDPVHPTKAGFYEIPGGVSHLAVQDDIVFVSGGGGWIEMLYVLRFLGEAEPTPMPTTTRTPRPVRKIAMEAENGYIARPGMDTGISTQASQCGFVETKLGNQGSVTLPFYVHEAGNYAIWARVMAAGEYTGNSFFVSIDGAERFWHEFIPPGLTPLTWFWSRVHTYERPTEERYYFAEGTHTLRFDGREMGARLDLVLVTNDLSYTPDMQDVVPCSSNTPTVTPTASPTASPMPTFTPTYTNTPTPSPTPTPTPTPVPRTRVLLPIIMKGVF